MMHAACQLPSWLIFDVGQNFPMKTTYLSLVVVAAVAAGCSRNPHSSGVSREVAAINAVRLELDAAIVARDAERVARIFTEDAVYLEPEAREIVGKQALKERLREGYELPPRPQKPRRVAGDVKVIGDWAFEWGHVESIRPPTGGPEMWIDGKYLHVYQRQVDGKWRISRACYTPNAPSTARLASAR